MFPSNVLESVPPHNLEAEMSVLGAMLLDNDSIDLVVPILNKNSFYKIAHQELFQAIINIYDRRRVVDLVLLREELKNHSLMEKVGGIEYLMELEEVVPSASNIEHYTQIVHENAIKRSLINAAVDIYRQANNPSSSTEELLNTAEKNIFDVTQGKFNNTPVRINSILSTAYEQISARGERDNPVTGLSTGFIDLDDLTSGLQPSELIVIAARPSMGKTSLALNILSHAGVVGRKPVALFSLEMSSVQVAQNMLCSFTRVDGHRVRKGFLNEQDWSKLSFGLGTLSGAPIFIDDTPGMTILEARAKARRLKMQHDIQLLVIDYIQLMSGQRSENRQQEVSAISRGLKALARELCIPVIAVAQLNRMVEAREGHKPRMSDLRESGSIEQDSDVVILLHRDSYYDRESIDNAAELIIAKQRNGPVGTVKLAYLSQYMRFENFAIQAPEVPDPANYN